MENALIFLRAAAPWISLGLMIAFFCVRPAISKSKKEATGGDHAVEGMCVGMCTGMAVGSMIGDGNGGLGASLGMLTGLAVGLCIRRKSGGAPLPEKGPERKETHGEYEKKYKKMQKKNKPTGRVIALSIAGAVIVLTAAAVGIYFRFGGFGTGECADTEEFASYAAPVSELTVPDGAQIIALGEATHGNREFQRLRLDVLQVLTEQYDVRAFALEGDFGGCEAVNRYIHGSDGTAAEALSATGFAIYRTEEMESLVEWMRDYNASAAPGEDLRFYGFDMEQYAYSYRYLLEALQSAGLDTAGLESIWDSGKNAYAEGCTSEQRAEVIRAAKAQLPPDAAQAVHFADVMLQNIELGRYTDDPGELNTQRDRMMAENTLWILRQEQARGNSRILISGHNNHIMRCQNAGSPVLGSRLAGELGSGYFAVGTDFYKSVCNLPKAYTGERITHTFYSYDPLTKASAECGFDESYLDFSRVPGDSSLAGYITGSIPMGSLGEAYSILMNFVPRSYRVERTPQAAYDAMIFVSAATPVDIRPANGR